MKKLAKYLTLVILIITYFILLAYCKASDMFFTITSGYDILNGNFYNASHLNNHPLVVQQWLYAVILTIFDKFGYIGDCILVFIQNIILVSLCSYLIYKKTKNIYYSIVGSIVGLIFSSNYMINIRPEIITIIIIMIQFIILEKYLETNKIKYLVSMIPLLILAANLHQAVFLYHIYVLIPFIISFNKGQIQTKNIFKKYRIKIDWKLSGITVLYLLCSLCTPYGLDGSLYIIRSLTCKAYKIIKIYEVRGFHISNPSTIILILFLVVTIYLIIHKRSNKYINFFIFTVFILTMLNFRHSMLMLIPIIYILKELNIQKLENTIIYSSIITSCIFIIFYTNLREYINKEDIYGDIAEVIDSKDAKIYNSAFDAGTWLEYNGFTVKFDSRIEIFSEELCGIPNLYEENSKLSFGHDFYNNKKLSNNEIFEVIDEYDYLVTYTTDYVNTIAAEKWNFIYKNDMFIVWKKK